MMARAKVSWTIKDDDGNFWTYEMRWVRGLFGPELVARIEPLQLNVQRDDDSEDPDPGDTR